MALTQAEQDELAALEKARVEYEADAPKRKLEEHREWLKSVSKPKTAAAATAANDAIRAGQVDLNDITVANMADPDKAKATASAIMAALRGDPDYRTT
jgi:3-hydroxy-3-methylglutaryl CoA synthase